MSRFGKSRLFDDDEEEDPSSFGYRSNGTGKNPFDDDADDGMLRMRTQIAHHEDACLESTQRALASIAESEKVGVATAEDLLSQREQLERVDQRLDDTQTNLKSTQRSINSIKSVWGGFASMFKKKESAAPPSPIKSAPIARTNLKGVVVDLDEGGEGSAMGRARFTTNRGTDVRGFYEDDLDEKNMSRSSTSSGLGQRGSDHRLNAAQAKSNSARMQEVDTNLDLMSEGLGRLKHLASGLNEEIESQNELLDRINDKVMDTDDTLWHQQKQIKRILK